MYKHSLHWIGLGTAIGFLSLGTTLLAQVGSVPKISEESITINAGDVFEILAVSDIRIPQYSWILTRNRNFLQAGQNAVFRNRFLEPGVYTLNAQIQGTPGEILSHTIQISVAPRTSTHQEEDTIANGSTLASSVPFRNSAGRIVLNNNTKVFLLKPARKSLALDVLPSIDTDGDSILHNDQDTFNTFFQEEGSPLYLWLASPFTEKSLVVHDTLDPTIAPQLIHVVSFDYAASHDMLTGEVDILHQQKDDGSFAFLVLFEGNVHPDIPLLTEWNFGDGEKSLVDAPVHTFMKSGTYNVSVHLHNLNTNETVATAQTSIVATDRAPPPEEPPLITPPDDSIPEPAPPEPNPLSLWLPTIMTIGGIVISALILLGGLFFIIKKIKRGRSTESVVAAMEEKVLKEKEDEPKEEPKGFPIERKKEDKKKEEKPTLTEEVDIKDEKVEAFEDASTPSWLKKSEEDKMTQVKEEAVVPPWLGGAPKPAEPVKPSAVVVPPQSPTPPPAKPVPPPPIPQSVPPPAAPPPNPPAPPPSQITKSTPTPPLVPKPVPPPPPAKPLPAPSPPPPKASGTATDVQETPIAFVKVDSIPQVPKPPPIPPVPPPKPQTPPAPLSPPQPKKEDQPQEKPPLPAGGD